MDRKQCRFCGKELKHTMVDLGLSPISNEYVTKENVDLGQYYYPLHVMVCEECLLAQAMEYKAPEQIFTNYKYFSSYSKSWLEHCKRYVDRIVDRLSLGRESLVYEIACNDGYLLQYFKPYGIPVFGIEPAENVAEETRKKGIDVAVEFWGEQTAVQIAGEHGRADLIIGNNVLAHVPDINGFVEGLRIALKETGTITMEFPHLLRLIELNQFDTIYQEHFSYLSLLTVRRIFQAHGLKIYDVEELATHGGSLRIYAAHTQNAACEVSENVSRVIQDEKEYGFEHMETYEDFAKKVEAIKRDSCKLLIRLKEEGKKIAAFGAAAKGNTFLNYCGIGREYIDFVADSSIPKQGLYLPGTRIPIVSPERIREEKPDYIVLLAWNLRDEFSELLAYTREWGCKLITFIPRTEVF
ncbi:MAG: class I SAM-dependent methyltransferase [Lachnospiraceae bacterium]|nr:class I SAM-dependent methyltransferase [Lachnospiraceae bacterium]